MTQKNKFRVAALVTDGFQEVELVGPVKALREAGAEVDIISDKPGEVQAFNNFDLTNKYPVDKNIGDARVEDYDAVFTPGGLHHPAIVAEDPRFTRFISQMNAAGKHLTAICRGTLTLAAADVVRGRNVTGAHTNMQGEDWWYLSVKDKMEQAGGLWQQDSPVVIDQNLITSRDPRDIPQFNAALLEQFGLNETKDAAEAKA